MRAFIDLCVAFVLAIVILWLIFRPQRMRIAVTSASLSRFNLTSSSTSIRSLSFDLSTNLTFRNPNKRAGIYYDWLEAQADYDGMRIAWKGLPVFYQGRKETTDVAAELDGRSTIGIGGGGEFERDNAAGVFPVGLWIFGQVRYKFRSAVTRSYVLKAFCPLRLPLGKAEVSLTDCRVLVLYKFYILWMNFILFFSFFVLMIIA
ncbi:NDR1/HIN1-like protein 10 [Phalaenopsis equestris]|uniref:NDR1/HIN1-like protein 10 n=1 Tax=Phalaenopsis equestris TaxID=78828 RepID=UPI0009E5A041|nr:NDR1/HIN1-like protein 10 [Phalaenopsis equestris]